MEASSAAVPTLVPRTDDRGPAILVRQTPGYFGLQPGVEGVSGVEGSDIDDCGPCFASP